MSERVKSERVKSTPANESRANERTSQEQKNESRAHERTSQEQTNESRAHERTSQEHTSERVKSERVKSTRANEWKTTESKVNEANATDKRATDQWTNEEIFQYSGESASLIRVWGTHAFAFASWLGRGIRPTSALATPSVLLENLFLFKYWNILVHPITAVIYCNQPKGRRQGENM